MSKGSMQRGNSEYNSWAGGGDLLCPTHVLSSQGFITRTSKIGSLRPVKLPEPKEENMSMDHAFLNPPRNMST